MPIADTPSVSSASSVLQSKRSRASTPPTDISSPHSHDEEFVLPPPTEEMLARRAQSDYASAEIGKRLLQGWAMLADECLNSTCYGVPLLRPPRRLTDLNPSTKVRKTSNSIFDQSLHAGSRMSRNVSYVRECILMRQMGQDFACKSLIPSHTNQRDRPPSALHPPMLRGQIWDKVSIQQPLPRSPSHRLILPSRNPGRVIL